MHPLMVLIGFERGQVDPSVRHRPGQSHDVGKSVSQTEPFERDLVSEGLGCGESMEDDPRALMPNSEWTATAPDFDVDCDQDGYFATGGHVTAGSRDELIAEIDAVEAERVS